MMQLYRGGHRENRATCAKIIVVILLGPFPKNMRRWPNVGLLVGQRRYFSVTEAPYSERKIERL